MTLQENLQKETFVSVEDAQATFSRERERFDVVDI